MEEWFLSLGVFERHLVTGVTVLIIVYLTER